MADHFKYFFLLFVYVSFIESVSLHSNDKTENRFHNETTLMQNQSYKSKGIYVVYGHGRRKERDLPVCEDVTEACNLAHLRYWMTPITERLCRCPKGPCPLTHDNDMDDSQHVSNRAQYKFCEPINEKLTPCENEDIGLEVHEQIRIYSQQPEQVFEDVRSKVLCTCPWPNKWSLTSKKTLSDSHRVSYYSCNQLPKCRTGDLCGYTRADTLETYYLCSCPQRHLCLLSWQQPTTFKELLHYRGQTHLGTCQLVYPEKPDF